MAGGLTLDHTWAFTFGVLGNIMSFIGYLAPVPKFYRVYKNKSAEGVRSVPYVLQLFSAMLGFYYAFLKTGYLLITINSIGCVMETIYITVYLAYAPKKAKIYTAKLVLVLNVGVFGLIFLLTFLLSEGSIRVRILGSVCLAFSVSIFVAHISRLVIKTKNGEFMSFSRSFVLTLSSVIWFSYGLLLKDKYIALPNILGLFQMGLYMAYKNTKKVIQEPKVSELVATGELGVDAHRIDVKPDDAQKKIMGTQEETELGQCQG